MNSKYNFQKDEAISAIVRKSKMASLISKKMKDIMSIKTSALVLELLKSDKAKVLSWVLLQELRF